MRPTLQLTATLACAAHPNPHRSLSRNTIDARDTTRVRYLNGFDEQIGDEDEESFGFETYTTDNNKSVRPTRPAALHKRSPALSHSHSSSGSRDENEQDVYFNGFGSDDGDDNDNDYDSDSDAEIAPRGLDDHKRLFGLPSRTKVSMPLSC